MFETFKNATLVIDLLERTVRRSPAGMSEMNCI